MENNIVQLHPAETPEPSTADEKNSESIEPEYEGFDKLVSVSIDLAKKTSDIPVPFREYVRELPNEASLKKKYIDAAQRIRGNIIRGLVSDDVDLETSPEQNAEVEELNEHIWASIDKADRLSNIEEVGDYRQILMDLEEGDILKTYYFDVSQRILDDKYRKQLEDFKVEYTEREKAKLDRIRELGVLSIDSNVIRTPQGPSEQLPAAQSA